MLSMVTIFTHKPLSISLLRNQAHSPKWVISPSLKFICSSSTSIVNPKKLILYSKPGCCLCDGLKEKLHAAISMSSSATNPLHNVELQIRDITTNLEWEKAYQYEIPVLAKLRYDGTERGFCGFGVESLMEQKTQKSGMFFAVYITIVESWHELSSKCQGNIGSVCFRAQETLPRLSPRLGVELIQKKIADVFRD